LTVPVIRKVWDRDLGGHVDMYSMNAKEAVKNDPKRYSLDGPPQPEPAPAAAPAAVRQPEAPLPQEEFVEPEVSAEPPSPPKPPRHKK
jgi:hypothetical protein